MAAYMRPQSGHRNSQEDYFKVECSFEKVEEKKNKNSQWSSTGVQVHICSQLTVERLPVDRIKTARWSGFIFNVISQLDDNINQALRGPTVTCLSALRDRQVAVIFQ